MGLFAFGRFAEHEKRGCVGNASHCWGLYRYSFGFDACALEWLRTRLRKAQAGKRERRISAALPFLLLLFYILVLYTLKSIFTANRYFSTGYEPGAVTAPKYFNEPHADHQSSPPLTIVTHSHV
jgi:hypothetical protein